jgi:hypothetical protein
MGHTTPHSGPLTPRSTDSVDERSKFLDDASIQHHYGTVDGSSNSTGKSYSVMVNDWLVKYNILVRKTSIWEQKARLVETDEVLYSFHILDT